MSRARDLARMLGRTEAANTDNVRLVFGNIVDSSGVDTIARTTGVGVNYYNTLDSLPVSSLTAGDQAFVAANNRLYVSNGNGWYNVSLVNLSPQFDSDVNSTFTIADSTTALVITNPASDSDNPDAIISYGGTMSDSGQYLVVLTRDSSIWTFTPLSADSVYNNVTLGNIPDSNGGDFTYTFTASDGVNQASKQVTITYSGLAAATYPTYTGGSSYGYLWGGAPNANRHMRFSLASDTNATLVEYMAINAQQATGGRSPTHGYYFGGISGPVQGLRFYRKFPWASETSDAAGPSTTFTKGRFGAHGNPVGPSNFDYIYQAGGYNPDAGARITDIERFPVASDTDNATDVGDLNTAYSRGGGATSGSHGYIVGGQLPTHPSDTTNEMIQKFPFAATATTTDAADLSVSNVQYDIMGANSETHGYSFGGVTEPPGRSDHIDKFPFASDANATDVGNLTLGRSRGGSVSSTTHGYCAGGESPSNTNIIDKFAFATDGNATDVGDLTEAMQRQASVEN